LYQVRYNIKTLSPILLTKVAGDTNMVSTLDYIPGSAILGIFAKKYIQMENCGSDAHKDTFFHDCFLNSGIIFTNAYITENDGKNITAFYPTPLSIQSPKEDDDKVLDLIKSDSDKQTQHIANYCKIKGNIISKINVSKSINFHHARDDRLKGYSDGGTIFNYESIDPWQEFYGRIIGNKDDLNYILSLFEKYLNINIGRSKNIQYGKAELRWISETPESFISEIDSFKSENLNHNFILTLLSAAIIYNENGFSSDSLSNFKKNLVESLGIPSNDVKINNVFKKNDTVENFVSKWLLKRPSEVSIKAGSCFDIEITNFNDNVKKALIELQKSGIGERLGEGFGRFALNLHESAVYKFPEEIDVGCGKPEGDIPEITKGIIKDISLKSYQASADIQALDDYKDFCKNVEYMPSNSLLGKLQLMLKDSSSEIDFVEKMNNLPLATRQNLRQCRNKSVNLFDFIKSGDDKILQILNQCAAFECYALIEFEPKFDTDLCYNIYNHYWMTFLASMRKENKIRRN